jgi:hypothetical protein
MAAKTKTMSTFKQILLLFHQGKKIKSLPEIALFLKIPSNDIFNFKSFLATV